MPSPRSERLTVAHWRQLRRLVAVAIARLDRLDISDPQAAATLAERTVVAGQTVAITLTAGYLTQIAAAEGRPVGPPDLVPAGRRLSGAPVGVATSRAAQSAAAALAAGLPAGQVEQRFARALRTIASTDVMTAARQQTAAATASPQWAGWRWRALADTCLGCLAQDNGRIRPGPAVLNGHPGCDCIAEPVPAGTENDPLGRPTGHDRFQAMTAEQQDALYGPRAARLRSGDITLDDVVHVRRGPGGAPVITDS